MRPLFLKQAELLRVLADHDPPLHRLLVFCLTLQVTQTALVKPHVMP